MIQQTNARQRHGPSTIDGPEEWGQWSGRKYYSLQIVQHPLRARMCGFGDKDRRPLAPAAVAKMVVRRDDNGLVEVDDVDCSFFVVTVDLWSADGKQEMNLVLHPSSADRYVPPPTPNTTKSRRKGVTTSSMGPPASSSSSSNTNSTSSLPPSQSLEPPFTPTNPPTWGYPSWSQNENSSEMGYRPWNNPVNTEPSTWGPQQAFNYDYSSSQAPATYSSPPSVPSMGHAPPIAIRSSFSHPHTNFTPTVPSIPSTPAPSSSSYSSIPLPRHTYTRTLVGPLSANATRLLDEHRKPGVFFLFQDLSVRTEGTFRLRMRLMNVGKYPAPEAGATGVMSIDDRDGHERGVPGVSPVLAQVYSEPFTVYSAKRFPGVPGVYCYCRSFLLTDHNFPTDTTALSIAFGNQGQKLPLRNRHGNSSGKRRRRGDDDDEDDSEESD
ncbi:MAG: velvet factor-domain-containing protein [Lentinula lateritia]|uniref:Velvet factor-domain-containing protein n=1 Tax=Lentinula lateritia TaxID=40482 RepID=A0ABQ8VK73_9AGAR|nr:MAG: velvet factor-domain-containing protein [Lentinula lateritia]KAJ4496787.1 velvet factor-domain-containing protein [Lentinula lateritia]